MRMIAYTAQMFKYDLTRRLLRRLKIGGPRAVDMPYQYERISLAGGDPLRASLVEASRRIGPLREPRISTSSCVPGSIRAIAVASATSGTW